MAVSRRTAPLSYNGFWRPTATAAVRFVDNFAMRRKKINHYADVICRMFMGWRMGDDLEALAGLPDGKIHVNLLTGTAEHSEAGPLNLHVAAEIQAWLRQECEKDGIDYSALKAADLWVDIDTSKIATNRKRIVCFDFDAISRLTTDEATYSAHVSETHRWHTRLRA